MPKILISRTDSIGDVVLTLPMAGILKHELAQCEIFFLGTKYTEPVIRASRFVDHFIDKDELLANPDLLQRYEIEIILYVFPDQDVARLALRNQITTRIGTSHRLYHWLSANRLVHFSRRRSSLHEAQLNLKLLKPLGVRTEWTKEEIMNFYGFDQISALPDRLNHLLDKNKFKIVFHPKSKGSAREWKLENYIEVAASLSPEYFQILVTGTKEEGEVLRKAIPQLFEYPHLLDCTGEVSLQELIALIHAADGLLACSTGPLHVAAALGKYALGLYPPMPPIHPARWSPLGKKAEYLVLDKDCMDCKKGGICACMQTIKPTHVLEKINTWKK